MAAPEPNKKKNGLLTGMIVGGAIGSVLSLLFSTEKGRKMTKKGAQKALDAGKSVTEKFLEKYRK